MQGLACAEREDGSKRSLSTEEVLQHWDIATCSIELLTRRLAWYRGWASAQDDHASPLNRMIAGRVRSQDSRSGRRHAKRVGLDCKEAARACPDHEELLERISCPWLLIDDEEVLSESKCVDCRRVRDCRKSFEVPPPGWSPPAVPSLNMEADAETDLPFKCTASGDDGQHCQQAFSTAQGLMNHLRAQHHIRNLGRVLTKTIHCPICDRVFRSKVIAPRHLQHAALRGCCGRWEPKSITNYVDPGDFRRG
eukprot:9387045-Pyramimonas_sp.AAC.1